MIRLALFTLAITATQAHASASAQLTPAWTGMTRTTVAGQNVFAAAAGAAVNNGSYSFTPGATSFPGMSTAMKNAISSAVTAQAPVTQSLAKKVAVGAMRALPGVLLTAAALEIGFSFVEDHWVKQNPSIYPTGPVLGAAYTCPMSSADAYCACESTIPYTIAVTGYLNGIAKYGKCNGNNWGPYNGQFTWVSPQLPAPLPVTEADWEAAPQAITRDLTDAELQSMVEHGYAIPIGDPVTKIAPQYVPLQIPMLDFIPVVDGNGNIKYIPKDATQLATDPVTGQQTAPYVQVEPAPQGQIRLTPYSIPLNPDLTPATDPQGQPLPPTKPEVDPCDLNPSRAGCSTLGDPTGAETSVGTKNVPIVFSPIQLSGVPAGSCPSPQNLSIGGMTMAIEYDPLCNYATTFRPILLAMAWLGAAYIIIAGSKSS